MRRVHVLKELWKDAGAGACPAGINGRPRHGNSHHQKTKCEVNGDWCHEMQRRCAMRSVLEVVLD